MIVSDCVILVIIIIIEYGRNLDIPFVNYEIVICQRYNLLLYAQRGTVLVMDG